MSCSTLLLCAVLGVSPATAPTVDPSIDQVCRDFSHYDHNGDGVVEIRSLVPLAHRGSSGRRVLVLVEGRLLEPLNGAVSLRSKVERLAGDLAADGYRADVLSVAFGKTELHQDGRYVLALREMLRAVAKKDALAGVLLVGHFPDSLLVRTCNWRRRGDAAIRHGKEYKVHKKVAYLRRKPEVIAPRADIVLSDLDGRWEDVYVQPKTQIGFVQAVFPEGIPPGGGRVTDLQQSQATYEDFFNIADGRVEVRDVADQSDGTVTATVLIDDACGDRECNAADRERSNPLARPDVPVSRLDARGIAFRPRPTIVGVNGSHLLDGQGQPQAVRFTSAKAVPDWRNGIWQRDPRMERRLLAEYLDRNHAYRTGAAKIAWRPASFACVLRSGYRVIARAARDWEDADATVGDVRGRPTALDFANWLRYPAIFRTIRAHSNPTGSSVRRGGLEEIEKRLDGRVWSWARRGDRLVPSLASACGPGRVNWFLLRTLWENGDLAPEPAFYLHTGCNIVSPAGAENPYDHPFYGLRQAADSVLLMANGLALVGRSKVYYDEPSGFSEALREGRPVGEAWARYFDIESTTRTTHTQIDRKRAYFWSVLGDPTLRLTRPARAEPPTPTKPPTPAEPRP